MKSRLTVLAFPVFFIVGSVLFESLAQAQVATVLGFQGGEGTPNDNWSYTSNGASIDVLGYATSIKKSGSTSLAVGGNNSSGGNCLTNCCTGNGPSTPHTFTFSAFDISSTIAIAKTLSFWYGNHPDPCSGTGWDSGENLVFTPYFNGVAQSSTTLINGASNLHRDISSTSYTYTVPAGVATFGFTLSISTNRNDEYLFLDDVKLTAVLMPLPITLQFFEVVVKDGQADLQWVATGNVRDAFYVIEGSSDGVRFKDLDTMAASEGLGLKGEFKLRLKDTEIKYFRLRVSSNGGNPTYSKIVYSVDSETNPWIYIFPNPSVSGDVNLLINGYSEDFDIEIFNELGVSVLKLLGSKSYGQFPIHLENSGVYLCRVSNSGHLSQLKFIVN